MTSLHTLSLSAVKSKLTQGEITPSQAVEACLDRIAATEPTIQACITVCAEEARREAARLEQEAPASPQNRQLPLWGVPVVVKDALCTKGIRTTCASRMLEHFVPPYDAVVIDRLKQAGAIILAKTNMDEFAMGSSTEFSAFGPTKNPWNTERVPGGSSGGSAASVVACQAFGALGSDTGGSIRLPAALCGCVGLKPTYGGVSRYGLVACGSSFDQVGPMARNVEDCARLFSAIAGYDPKDAVSADLPAPSLEALLAACGRTDLSGLTLGLPIEYVQADLSPETASAFRAAVQAAEGLGATIRDVSLPHLPYSVAAYHVLASGEAGTNLARFDGMRYGLRVDAGDDSAATYTASRSHGFGDEVKRRILVGTYVLSAAAYDAYYTKATKVRRLIRDEFLQALASCDALLAPTTLTTAWKAGAFLDDPLAACKQDFLTCGLNLAGLPGLSLPVGFGSDSNLPVGLQIMGRAFDETGIFSIAGALEKALPKIGLPKI